MKRLVFLSLLLIIAAVAGASAGGWESCEQQCFNEYMACTPDLCCDNNPYTPPVCPVQISCYDNHQECLSCCSRYGEPCALC